MATLRVETVAKEALSASRGRVSRAKKCIRSITAQECAEYLHAAFDTSRQFVKAKAILSAVFSTAHLPSRQYEIGQHRPNLLRTRYVNFTTLRTPIPFF